MTMEILSVPSVLVYVSMRCMYVKIVCHVGNYFDKCYGGIYHVYDKS